MVKKKTPEIDTEEKVKEAKKNVKSANKAKEKNKVSAAAKRLADQQLMDMADKMPAGQGNQFVVVTAKYEKAVAQRRLAAKVVTSVRNELKAMKIDMQCFDRVMKLKEMDPQDVRAKKATEAIYESQLGMEISDDQKARLAEIDRQREEARNSLRAAHGGDSGKEVGSGNGADSDNDADGEGIPERNDEITADGEDGDVTEGDEAPALSASDNTPDHLTPAVH